LALLVFQFLDKKKAPKKGPLFKYFLN